MTISVKSTASHTSNISAYSLSYVLLTVIYIGLIHTKFQTGDSLTLNFSLVKSIVGFVLLVFLVKLLPVSARKPSDILLHVTLSICVVPFLVYASSTDQPIHFIVPSIIGFLIIYLVQQSSLILPIPYIKISSKWLYILISIFCLIPLLYLWKIIGINHIDTNFQKNLYPIRAMVSERLSEYTVLNYTISNVLNACLPFIFAIALYYKHFLVALGIFSLFIIYYFFLAQKFFFFAPLFIIGLFVSSFITKNRTIIYPYALITACITALLLAPFWEINPIIDLLIRRALFVPADITFSYFKFFEEHGFIFFGNSVLSWLGHYPYEVQPTLLLSQEKYGDMNTTVPTGLWGAGYMHMDNFGVLLFSLFAGIILKIVDQITKENIALHLSVMIIFVPFLVLILAADFSTTLLTHGLGMALICTWLLYCTRRS